MFWIYKTSEELSFYKNFTEKENIFLTGNPKHDPKWINYLRSEKNKNTFINEHTILFLSRSLNSYYTTQDRIETIKMLKGVTESYPKLKLAIKLHPKENLNIGKKIYNKILGKVYSTKGGLLQI